MITKSMLGLSIAAIFAVAMIAGLSGQIPFVAADEGEIELKTILVDGDGNKVGEAKFELEENESELKVELEGSLADTVSDISIAGNSLGMIATDSNGDGEAKWEPSPVLVSDGDTITLTDEAGNVLTGTFAAEVDEDEDEEDEEDEDEEDEEDEDE
ncbi:MAG: hypothetical protein ACE5RN_07265 [Nitrosopumilaceae archaeon]